MFSGIARVSHLVCQFVSFFVSPVCLLVRVTVADKNKAVKFLLASHIGHKVIRKEEKKA
jgi:hypothetical protein